MIAIVTGDNINSREVKPKIWLDILKDYLSKFGIDPKSWQIFKRDSFQFQVNAGTAFETVLQLKAAIKHIENLDVRLAIELGDVTHQAKKITESNGSAFINSDECFDALKKQTLAVKSDFENFDAVFNTIIQFVSFTADNWSIKTAEIIRVALENPTTNQVERAKLLTKKSQSTISAALKRAAFDEIKAVVNLYKSDIKKIC